jgi:hypothetical protein
VYGTVVSGGGRSLSRDVGEPVEPVPQHVSDDAWLLRRPEPRHVELARNRALGKWVAAPIEWTPCKDPEAGIS